MPHAIDLHRLGKRYGRTIAVDDLTCTFQPGRVTGLVGPNGAGKSTTMRLILGLDRPSSGRACIGGRAYRDLRNPQRTVGALLDASAAHPGRSARNHLRWLAAAARMPRSRVDELLDIVGLATDADRLVGTYSLGMRQRLGLAGALLGDPTVLLFDEPVNGLDVDGIRWIRGLLRTLAAEGRTVLVSSHLMTELAETAHHVVVIARGRLLADVSIAELTAGGVSLEEAYVRLVGSPHGIGGSDR